MYDYNDRSGTAVRPKQPITGEEFRMKKSGIVSIIIAALAVAAAIAAMCVYMEQLTKLWNEFWDKLQEKRADLRVYME